MKKLCYALAAILVCTACAITDKDLNPNDNDVTPKDSTEVACTLELVKDEIEFEYEEDSANAYFYASGEWRAEVTEGEDWLTISSESGEGSKSKQKIKVKVAENTSKKEREGEIVFEMEDADSQILVVIQAGKKEAEQEDDSGSDDNIDPTPDQHPWSKLVASIQHCDYQGGNVNYTFKYDEQGRILKYTRVQTIEDYGGYEWIQNYTYRYSPSQVKIYWDSSDTIGNETEEGTIVYDFSDESLIIEGNKKYSLDSKGRLKTVHYESELLHEYIWNGDNPMSVFYFDKLLDLKYETKENKCNLNFYLLTTYQLIEEGEEMIDRSVFGFCAGKNLLKTIGDDKQFSYEFDDQGYVTKVFCWDIESGDFLYDLSIAYEE